MGPARSAKGIHLARTAQLLGLDPTTPPHDHTEIFQGVECDLTTNEASDALRLLRSGNANMLERILSPMQTHTSPDLDELRSLAYGTLSRRYARHYGGLARGMRRELTIEPTVKKLLYAYRVLLTGITLLRSGIVEPNVTTLAPESTSKPESPNWLIESAPEPNTRRSMHQPSPNTNPPSTTSPGYW